MTLESISVENAAKAVRAYNATFGEMDRVLWYLSRASRRPRIEGRGGPVVEALVRTVKSWWGVQGVKAATKGCMAEALATMPWSPELFADVEGVPENAESFACGSVAALVSRTMSRGAHRREFSLASKVLHWLLPWRIPVCDSFVRGQLGVPSAWDHPAAYSAIARGLFSAVRRLEPQGPQWLCDLGPRSCLRGLDKYLWWSGGGDTKKTVVVRGPWRVVARLGLRPC